MENEFSRKHNFKNPEDCGLARHLGLPYQDECLYYSECLENHRTHRVHYHWPLRRNPYLEEPAWRAMVKRSSHYG